MSYMSNLYAKIYYQIIIQEKNKKVNFLVLIKGIKAYLIFSSTKTILPS